MASRLLCAIAAFAPLSSGLRKRAGHVSKVAKSDCESLTDIVVKDKDFTFALQLVCKVWPENLGEFPLEDVGRAQDLIEQAFGRGGAWEKIKEIREKRGSQQFCWRNETLRVEVESDCEMESRGTCYGACPYGFKPGLLSGIFKPACTTACGASTHPVTCGFGCASSLRQCARTILDQVSVVASGVGEVASFLTGNDRISNVVDAVTNFAEFLLRALPLLVDAVKGAFAVVRGGEGGAMVAVLLIQYIIEVAPEVGQTVESIKDAFREMADIIADLAEERFTTGADINPRKVIRAILDHGPDMLDYAVSATKAFSFGKCQVAEDVVFTIEEAGDERLMGPWVQRGEMHGHPKYTVKGDRTTILEWSTGNSNWVMFSDGWTGSIGRRYLYESNARSSDYPLSGWTALSGPEPLPEFVAVRPRE